MCRSRYQTSFSTYPQTQTIFTTPRQRREARRQVRFEHRLNHGCCSKRTRRYQDHQIFLPTNNTYTATHSNSANTKSTVVAESNTTHQYTAPSHLQPITESSQPPLCTTVRYRGPIVTMAALIIGGIGLGAQKIQEKREKRKSKKAALLLDQEQTTEVSRMANLQHVERVDRRKSVEARGGGMRRSESLEREREESGEAPPSYEEVVRTGRA